MTEMEMYERAAARCNDMAFALGAGVALAKAVIAAGENSRDLKTCKESASRYLDEVERVMGQVVVG